jgi:hypothetical protein
MTYEQAVEKVDLDLLLSFQWKQESSSFNKFWTPAFAGVPSLEGFSTGCEDMILSRSCLRTEALQRTGMWRGSPVKIFRK